jgi:hypothetical protein
MDGHTSGYQFKDFLENDGQLYLASFWSNNPPNWINAAEQSGY